MNKKIVYFVILGIVLIIGLIAFFNYSNNNKNYEDEGEKYNATKTSQNITNQNNQENSTIENASAENNTTNTAENSLDNSSENIVKETIPATEETPKKEPKETEISSFSTKIYTKDSNRQNNLTLACSALNNTTVENGKTFSFSNTVGKATTKKGYKKADVFKNGEVIEALGGGLCQVSTTLYNAVLKIKDIKVTERHEHSNKVPYIQDGKDAAVSYGTYDFKFVNNTGNTLKIKASNTKNNVTVKLIKIE